MKELHITVAVDDEDDPRWILSTLSALGLDNIRWHLHEHEDVPEGGSIVGWSVLNVTERDFRTHHEAVLYAEKTGGQLAPIYEDDLPGRGEVAA